MPDVQLSEERRARTARASADSASIDGSSCVDSDDVLKNEERKAKDHQGINEDHQQKGY